jgi:hypothetical protein
MQLTASVSDLTYYCRWKLELIVLNLFIIMYASVGLIICNFFIIFFLVFTISYT